MNGYRERIRKILAMLLCVVFVCCQFSMTSLAEEGFATPTDLAGEPEPFERLPLPLGGKRGQGLDL